MSYKRILRFYFYAERLNRTLDGLIVGTACASGEGQKGCAYYAEKIGRLIEVKEKLNELWLYLDGVVRTLTEADRTTLCRYASMRGGVKGLSADMRREIHRAVVKFSRRVHGAASRFGEQLSLLQAYYCLIPV